MSNDETLKWLIAREIPHLRRFAALLARDPSGVDELVQDCLERALRKRHLWSRRGSLRSWLFRLLYRRHVDRLRSLRAHRKVFAGETDGDQRVQPANQHQQIVLSDVLDAMARLPDDQQAAILLVGVEGLSYEEAAGALDIPVGTLRSRLSRGRDRLRETWSPEARPAGLRRVK